MTTTPLTKSRCANHMHYAMAWRESVVSAAKGGTAQMALAV